MGNHCTQSGSHNSGAELSQTEIEVNIAQAERFQKKCQELERENKELQTLTQQLTEAQEHSRGEVDSSVEVVRAQEAAREAYEEASRLRQRVTELEELGQDHERTLQEKISELEEQERRLQEKMSQEEEATTSNPPAMRELVALQAERRALVTEKAELEQTLAERHAQLNHTEGLAQRLQEEKLEAESQLAKLQKEENESLTFTGHTDASQTELERLRSENAALGAQCRGLAELAENACKRAEDARLRFEQAELAARRREAECDGSGFVETASEPFEAGTFSVPGALVPQIRGPTFPEGPTGISASTSGTPAPDVALNASLPPDGDHTPQVYLPPEQATAAFGRRPSQTVLSHSMSSGHSADAVFLTSPGMERREFVDQVSQQPSHSSDGARISSSGLYSAASHRLLSQNAESACPQAPRGFAEPVSRAPRGPIEPVSLQAVGAMVEAASCPSTARLRVPSPSNTMASPQQKSSLVQPSSPGLTSVSPRPSMARNYVHAASAPGVSAAVPQMVHLQADVTSPQATFTPPPQSAMRTVRCAGVSVQPAGSMSMQMLASNTPTRPAD